MKFLLRLALAGLLALASVQAQATVVITDSPGGKIVDFVRNYEDLRYEGEKVVIDGSCASACTLILGLLPKSQFCATKGSRFGFHTATVVSKNEDGTSWTGHATEFTAFMWALYPKDVRRIVKRAGWDGDHPDKPHTNIVWVNASKIAPICTEGDLK